jgi:hypothetical protein
MVFGISKCSGSSKIQGVSLKMMQGLQVFDLLPDAALVVMT